MHNVFFINFPNTKVDELVTLNEDGSYSIFINSRLSHEAALKAYTHALNHIKNGDFYKCSDDLNAIEKKAEGGNNDTSYI